MLLADLANVRQLQAVQTKAVSNYLMNDVFFNIREFNPMGVPNGTSMSLTVSKFPKKDLSAGVALRQFGVNATVGEYIAVPETYHMFPIANPFYDDKALSRGLTENGIKLWLDSQVTQALNVTKLQVAKAFIDGATGAQGNIAGLKSITTDKSLTYDVEFDGTVGTTMAQAQAFLAWFNAAKASVPYADSIECSTYMATLLETMGQLLNQYTTEIIVNTVGGNTRQIPVKRFGGMAIVPYGGEVDFTRDDAGDIYEEFYFVHNSDIDGIALAIPDNDTEIFTISMPNTDGNSVENGVVELLTQVVDMTEQAVVRVTGYKKIDVV